MDKMNHVLKILVNNFLCKLSSEIFCRDYFLEVNAS